MGKGIFHSTKVMVENTPWLKSKQLKYQTPWRLNNYYSLLYEEPVLPRELTFIVH